ncbi:hypothetical protein ACTI_57800 [Actinoplanes sp. OR16]|uniref:ArsR/SmtB family transcription factor n=1 Tax=Actinoplanes sp. OR16 TaxID=946334 RepID=UPI000F70A2C7|nr:winged helix-turn-helix domain-containing protein [Actinoplanes sp. OR16]BBH69095.1 hypothetical protein ACTI_57800 [Actinoplanes sp. OR16]
MTDDVRDRILGLLHTGPATVAALSARLGLPGGVVNYHLKMLEQSGLVRVGASRRERGVTVPRYVSTAAAAQPPLRVPAPIPGLTWTGTGRFPIPLWTVAAAHTTPDGAPETAALPVAAYPAAAVGASGSRDTSGSPEPLEPPSPHSSPAQNPSQLAPSQLAPSPRAPMEAGDAQLAAAQAERSPAGPRLVDVRRIPLDDATFYEFASRLDALTREFAARATADAPAAELAIALYRPPSEAATGNGS